MSGSDQHADIDRQPPLLFWNSARSYIRSANYLVAATESGNLRLSFSAPVYNLFAHGLELTLKAFLVGRGVTPDAVRRKYGHDIARLFEACCKAGLSIPEQEARRAKVVIAMIGAATLAQDFRYQTTGYYQLPSMADVAEVADLLLKAVEPHARRAL